MVEQSRNLFRNVIAENNYTVQPEPCAFDAVSGPEGETQVEKEYRACGRVVGMSLLTGNLMGVPFARFFLKRVLSESVDISDLEIEDPQYAKQLKWLLENSLGGIVFETMTRVPSSASMVLSAPTDRLMERVQSGGQRFELVPGGANIDVTDANKDVYVSQVIQHKLNYSIQRQVNAFRSGLLDVIPDAALHLFSAEELQQEISGAGLDSLSSEERANAVRDWEANTLYQGTHSEDSPVVKWFWELLGSDDPEIRKELPLSAILQFTTGSSRVPVGGFSQLAQNGQPRPFTIDSAADNDQALPTASTCTNVLHLPKYSSKETLRKKLIWALSGGTGFGLV
eukprot:NODE_3034_length_1437_cov_40.518265_g2637_i0.p1 GENE.NODE_3034_length_1437_cov_40.518265_g2637_i0~~NODE_3034_length_1437_cov_40.518265_g2637_i0.p1  ORF type:complete len:388 (-),score=106.67 NODE_3034_length_1437_cov_40.518265_g2637_i0:272-1291(-)